MEVPHASLESVRAMKECIANVIPVPASMLASCQLLHQQRDLTDKNMRDIANQGVAKVELRVPRDTAAAPPTESYSSLERRVFSFYSFNPIQEPQLVADQLQRVMMQHHVKGRVYVAKEGINAQCCVPSDLTNDLEAALKSTGVSIELNQDPHLVSVDSGPFKDLHVRVRPQVLQDKLPDGTLDMADCRKGQYLSSKEFHKCLSEADNAIVLDCRNSYEYEVGHFEGSIPLNTLHFAESWSKIDALVQEHREKPIYMYCTGGIRCVKVGAYIEQVLGKSDVFALDRGVVGYLGYIRQHPTTDSLFKGKLFTFDQRMTTTAVTTDIVGTCELCSAKSDRFTNCFHGCGRLFNLCPSCSQQFHGYCSLECTSKSAEGPLIPSIDQCTYITTHFPGAVWTTCDGLQGFGVMHKDSAIILQDTEAEIQEWIQQKKDTMTCTFVVVGTDFGWQAPEHLDTRRPVERQYRKTSTSTEKMLDTKAIRFSDGTSMYILT